MTDVAKPRSLKEICEDIRENWRNKKGPSVYFGAVPYLEAMEYLGARGKDYGDYGVDTASTIVMYFLSNATTFRGEAAKRIKDELKRKYSYAR